MLQIGVIQFVQKRAPKTNSLSVKKIDLPWSPGTREYVESVWSSPINMRNLEKNHIQFE
jgi:hypothetical protein